MLKRREFLRKLAALFSIIISGCLDRKKEENQEELEVRPLNRTIRSQVYVIKTDDRALGVKELLKYHGTADLSGKKVLEETGVIELAGKKGFEVVVLDDLKSGWSRVRPQGSHWKTGFLFPDVFSKAGAVVQTCCLKTHRFGGHFTMSLKNSVGMVARYDPDDGYDYMGELHGSRYQRQMIAEINTAYEPEFVIMDGIEGFSKGGPDTGTLISPGILLASRDRVAVDAAGVALLRIFGTTDEVERGGIFEQEQIARSVELGIGVSAPEDIEIIAINEEAGDICKKIEEKLRQT